MRQYFINKDLNLNDVVELDDKQAHHVKDVLRMKNGDAIRIVDNSSRVFIGSLSIDNDYVTVSLNEEGQANDTANDIIYCAAMIKKDKWELLLQKATELGATKIVPIITKRTIIHLEDKEINKKVERWNKITLEASQQSQRSKTCEVLPPVKLKNIKDYMSETNLVPYENEEGRMLIDYVDDKSITFVIGPEGGFDYSEIEYLYSLGFTSVSLGARILRAETAGMYCLSVIDAKRNM